MCSSAKCCFRDALKPLWSVVCSPVCKIEVPERLTVSYDALKSKGLDRRCVGVPTRQATDEEILLVHR